MFDLRAVSHWCAVRDNVITTLDVKAVSNAAQYDVGLCCSF